MDSTVFIVDDDPALRDALCLLLGLHGYRTAVFANAESFLAAWRADWRGCVLIDIRMRGMDGLSLQQTLLDRTSTLPAIVITGHGDTASARAAFRAQAVDFLEKPLDETRLLAAIEEALARHQSAHRQRQHNEQIVARLALLTPREREIMELVVAGWHNREVAAQLTISVRTVEVHKARMMSKLGAENIPQLVRMSLDLAAPNPGGDMPS